MSRVTGKQGRGTHTERPGHMTPYRFGHIPGYPEGSCFASRAELSRLGLHRPLVAGIAGSGHLGSPSVVLAGGYEDTQDFGEVILYTGQGGRDSETGRQMASQTLTRGNLALAVNKRYGFPVRVIRGARQPSAYAPEAGYRYDGLYVVEDYWREAGKSGFDIWRYRLCKQSDGVNNGRSDDGPLESLITDPFS